MTQLSSSFQTVMQRRVVPAIMAAVLGGSLLMALFPHPAPAKVIALMLMVEGLVVLVYGAMYRATVAPTVDSVVLEGDALHVRKRGQQAVIPLSSIARLHGRTGVNPETITVELNMDSPVGRSITFIPQGRFPSIHAHPTLTALQERVAACPAV